MHYHYLLFFPSDSKIGLCLVFYLKHYATRDYQAPRGASCN